MAEKDRNKPATHSTAATRYSDARTTRYRQYLDLVKTYADDIGEPNAGQQTLLAMLEVPLRTLQDIRDKLNIDTLILDLTQKVVDPAMC